MVIQLFCGKHDLVFHQVKKNMGRSCSSVKECKKVKISLSVNSLFPWRLYLECHFFLSNSIYSSFTLTQIALFALFKISFLKKNGLPFYNRTCFRRSKPAVISWWITFYNFYCIFAYFHDVCLCLSTYKIQKCIVSKQVTIQISSTADFFFLNLFIPKIKAEYQRRKNGSTSQWTILPGLEVGRSSLHAHRCQQSFSICHFARWTTFDRNQKNGFNNFYLLIFWKGFRLMFHPLSLPLPIFKLYTCQSVFCYLTILEQHPCVCVWS